MAARKKMKAVDFAREYLRKKPKAEFAEVRDAAKKKRLDVIPVVYGRAKALEGIVPVAKYGSKKKAKAAKAKAPARGPGRPKGSKNKRSAGTAVGVDGLVATIQNLQNERDRALEAIEKIRAVLETL